MSTHFLNFSLTSAAPAPEYWFTQESSRDSIGLIESTRPVPTRWTRWPSLGASRQMGKKEKLRPVGKHVRSGTDYQIALQKLQNTNLDVILDVLEKFILDISRAEEFPIEERRKALGRLLGT